MLHFQNDTCTFANVYFFHFKWNFDTLESYDFSNMFFLFTWYAKPSKKLFALISERFWNNFSSMHGPCMFHAWSCIVKMEYTFSCIESHELSIRVLCVRKLLYPSVYLFLFRCICRPGEKLRFLKCLKKHSFCHWQYHTVIHMYQHWN